MPSENEPVAEANEGKKLEVVIDGQRYERIPIKTHVVMRDDVLLEVVEKYAGGLVRDGDVLFVTEKIVGITQGRAFPLEDIAPRKLAVTLSKYVTKTSHGIGLGIPETMEMALRECGTIRILFAAAVSAVTKLFGRKGDFYRIAGDKARAIDGPTSGTIPPYNKAVVLGPERPREVARHLKEMLGGSAEVAVVDINDLGGNILGSTLDKAGDRRLVAILKDNPLGQGHQSTPLGVVRAA
jgi:F420-0:gamma-glutamyl ligase-like protein